MNGFRVGANWGLSKYHVREFSCGKMYYRTFYLDEKRDTLYIGAMDRVFKLNLSNISHSNCERDSLQLEPGQVTSCVAKGKSEVSSRSTFDIYQFSRAI
ncbi:Hypothetical predicted protein [Cloeon dipterum]|uniref:Sema domain-containing protein n=1 Tax=Cloeon dipterum TaxID=197152 RepID=A0A8S1DU36_9INSE|nr:Hypothetical predicted protein [Cloeon dipterum]